MSECVAPEQERFAKNTTIMAQAVLDGIKMLNKAGYNTGDVNLIELATKVIANFDHHYLIQGFIEKSHKKCWDQFKAKNEKFFIENASDIFKFLPSAEVDLFKDLYLTKDAAGNQVVPKSLIDQIWDLFDADVKIAIKYIHKGRAPYSYQTADGTFQNAYGASFFDEVDLAHHANVWDVRLEFPVRV